MTKRRKLPDGWRWSQLQEVSTVEMGQSPKGLSYNSDGIGFPLLNGPTEFGPIHPTPIQWTIEPIRFAQPGDVLLCVRGATTGRRNISDQVYCIGRGLAAIRGNSKYLLTEFLDYALEVITHDLLSEAAGSTFLNLPGDKLKRADIPLPPIEEQQRIVTVLNEKLAAVAQARQAAQAQLEAAQALPAAYLRAIFDSPEAQSWPRYRLGDVLIQRREIIHPRNNPRGTATFVGLEHIESGTGVRIGSLPAQMEELTGRKPKYYKDDIVYGYLRPYLNKVWIAEFDGLCSVDQYVYSVNAELANVEFVAWFMRSSTYLKRAPIGLTPGQLPRIRTEEVAAVVINLPSLDKQQQIMDKLNHRMATVKHLASTLETQFSDVEAMPAAYLRQAFNGEL
ncbi:MAG: restriction endonuclease subunit S [Anaerolinea sp.]|nr:restriction endonuclease subunit S [Anaerolinea sp.]